MKTKTTRTIIERTETTLAFIKQAVFEEKNSLALQYIEKLEDDLRLAKTITCGGVK